MQWHCNCQDRDEGGDGDGDGGDGEITEIKHTPRNDKIYGKQNLERGHTGMKVLNAAQCMYLKIKCRRYWEI